MEEIQIAEDYRRQRLKAEVERLGIGSMGPAQFLNWAEKNREKLLGIVNNFGVGEDEAEGLVSDFIASVGNSSQCSEYDDAAAHAIIGTAVERIVKACEDGGIVGRGGVVFGSLPGLDLNASASNVMGTDVSILSVSSPLLAFCNQVSKALVKTLAIVTDSSAIRIDYEQAAVERKLKADPQLTAIWALLIAHYAVVRWPPKLDFGTFELTETAARIQIVESVTLFAVAHEYGHHILKHNNASDSREAANIFEIEHEADFFARAVSFRIGTNAPLPNLIASSGAAAVILLGFTELVGRARYILEKDPEQTPLGTSTHPAFDERIAAISAFDQHAPDYMQEKFVQMREDFRQIIEIIWREIEQPITKLRSSVG